MENAQLIGLSRQVVLRRQLDVVANNLANLNTTGYKRDRMVFEEFVMPTARMNEFENRDKRLSFVHDRLTFHEFAPGAITQTGNPLDVALGGNGYFVVEGENGGELFTRAGSFVTNELGELVTLEGRRVLGEGGPITFSPTDTDITISGDGTISTSEGVRGQLRVVQFEDENILKKASASLFSGEGAQAAQNAQVIQGSIEQSNVQAVSEITKMIEVSRAYQSVARMQEQASQLRQDAIDKLGRADS
ncbi:flagellar basal-body rod protein FlgF [Coralliovum pocilloporae]|uniref:flagellar basal-body rod protein FlgF n=1 Tax=Coralliovum pocilloporae TaxID=3066369 RepID=UPI0033077511